MSETPAPTWFVYILRCSDGTLYTGVTLDLDRRCRQHNAGTASRYTRSRLPAKLVYREEQPGQGSALKREASVKRLTRREKLALICRRATAAQLQFVGSVARKLPDLSVHVPIGSGDTFS